jgi:hypothetical protein
MEQMADAVLSQTMIESEEAHFASHLAPKVRLTSELCGQFSALEVEEYFHLRIRTLVQWERKFQTANIPFDAKWGYQYFKALYDNFAEYILHTKNSPQSLAKHEVQRILDVLKQSDRTRIYLSGARLCMLLENQEALSDAELHFLLNEEPWPRYEGAILRSYHELKVQQILSIIKSNYLKHGGESGAESKLSTYTTAACLCLVGIIQYLL